MDEGVLQEVERIKNIPMLFVLGVTRSGTTLLQSLLDANPSIVGPPESQFILILYPRFGHIKNWKEADIINFADALYIDPLFKHLWNVDKKVLTEKFMAIRRYADYALLCKMVYYQMRRDKENVHYLSDKNPKYMLFLNQIIKIFPEAKFIHIVREPRDNVYSHLVSFGDTNPLFRANKWLACNRIVEKAKQKDPGKYLTILYEDLVKDTPGKMKAICIFLNIPFVDPDTKNVLPELLKTHVARENPFEHAKQLHKNLLQPVNTSHIGKWKNDMTPLAQAETVIVTGDFAKKIYKYDMGEMKSKHPHVSGWRLFKGKLLYITWQAFTRIKFRSLYLNMAYMRFQKMRKGDKLPPGDYF